jgi:hypothetical protein
MIECRVQMEGTANMVIDLLVILNMGIYLKS